MEKKFTPKTLREIKTFDTFEISKDFLMEVRYRKIIR